MNRRKAVFVFGARWGFETSSGGSGPENADAHLVSFPVKVFRGIYHNLINEFVDQLRRQLFDLDKLFHLVDEALQICFSTPCSHNFLQASSVHRAAASPFTPSKR